MHFKVCIYYLVHFFKLKCLVEKCIRTFRSIYIQVCTSILKSSFRSLQSLCKKNRKHVFSNAFHSSRTTRGKTQKFLVKNTLRKSISTSLWSQTLFIYKGAFDFKSNYFKFQLIWAIHMEVLFSSCVRWAIYANRVILNR